MVRHGRFPFFLLAAALALCGCGPKGETTGSGSGTTTVHLAFFPNVTHAVALVGTANGAFARALGPNKIEERIFMAGPSEIEALFGDQVDIGYIGPGPALNGFLKSKGRALRIIAGACSGGASLVVRQDAGINDIKGLAGRKVAVPQTGGTQDISLRHALQQAGLNSTDTGGSVTVLPMAPADTLTLFVKKELDAAWAPEPWVERLVKEGNGKILVDERALWPGKKFATTVLVARAAFLQAHPDLVKKFLEAHVATVDTIAGNPDAARKIVGDRIKALTGKALPDAILSASLARTDFTYDPLRESVLTFADWSKALGYQREDRSALGELIDLKPLNTVLTQRKLAQIP
jgi:NitT/TauT family transport system substrate-binding protein